ncbi:MAG: dihydrofolate reductase [Clostridia bacterium]
MITIIAAIGRNNELGKNNDLIWNLPNDLKFFKQQTLNSIVAMGKNTLESLPKLLPNRKHIILSLDNNFNKDILNSEVYQDKDQFINRCKKLSNDNNLYIIGGASIYSMFINIADCLVLTEIDAEDKEATVYFPQFNKNDYNMEYLSENSDGDIKYKHIKYIKK